MSLVSKELIDRLLYQEESDSLDFKEEQYKFFKAEKHDKCELLKDIIAFANSWTPSTSYILIGVRERKGEKSEVLGISEHLDDANIQEFVNKKINRPINFSYITFEYESFKIGVIEIPNQERPFYLKNKFSKLNQETVYIRRGSSTDIASIDEISKMSSGAISSKPKLTLEICDGDTYKPTTSFENTPPRISEDEFLKIPDYAFQNSNYLVPSSNKNFYRESYEYILNQKWYNRISFKVTNEGNNLSKNSILKFTFPENQGLYFDVDEFYPPSRDSSFNFGHIDLKNKFKEPDIELDQRGGNYSVLIRLGDILPKDSVFSTSFYIASNKTQDIVLQTNLYSENLPDPLFSSFNLSFTTNFNNISSEELLEKSKEIN